MTAIETSILIKLICAEDYLPREQVSMDREVARHRIHDLRKRGIPIRTIFAKPHRGGKQALGYRLEEDSDHTNEPSTIGSVAS